MFQLSLDFTDVQLDRLNRVHPRSGRVDHAVTWKHQLKVHVVFRMRARRYLLGLRPDGDLRLVIPRRGTEDEGFRFLERSEQWILKRVAHWRSRHQTRQPWQDGSRFLFRGEEIALRVRKESEEVALSFADQVIRVEREQADYREAVRQHLRAMAESELPPRTYELAQLHGIEIKRVSIRAQKTRWGSCSAHGTISLNWRLIQAPPFVVDYLIIHELMHRRQMNHSPRYWRLVAEAFPDYQRAELWLKKSGIELRI